ncbi:MAG TPA: M23 family metallopeptidase [Bacteroidia bacterium]|jgi:murein DD-endopeptidase MepM/ murein hydrolase activator NlpD|nr:M23 family metallopeptidase [Bacteroidia bacterium]
MPILKAYRRKLARNLKSKFRLVVLNDQTLEEKFALRLTPMNVLVFGGTFALSLITITLYLIAFTPIREYIPGYADVNMRRSMVNMTLKTDTLLGKVSAQEHFIENMMKVINGQADSTKPTRKQVAEQLYDSIHHLEKSEADSQLRLQIEGGDRYALDGGTEKAFSSGIGSYSFFTPLKGSVTTKFNTAQKHYGIDIVSGPNEVIKSALDGTVVIANFTSETGYVIGVQHSNNLFTLYKHNSALLKNVGDYVKAGEVIAVIGNTGEYSSGPHLHLELWFNGSPVNPLDYISF